MIFLNVFSSGKSKRIILPGILIKDIKPISLLLKPSNLAIPLLLVSILSQLSDNFKNTLNVKDIQSLSSVKCYRKLLFFGFNSVSLSVIQAISRTLGPELESLYALDVSQRFLFLKDLQLKAILYEGPSKLVTKNLGNLNSLEVMKYRKGLALQFRSAMVSNSIFSPNSISFGLPLSSINLDFVLYSSRLIWLSLGLLEEDFDFLLRKEAVNCLKTFNMSQIFNFPSNNVEALKIIFFKEVRDLVFFDTFLDLKDDNIILKGEDNLVLLEKELGFIKRGLPVIPNDVFVLDKNLDDTLLRAALDQRRKHKLSFTNIFNLDKQLNIKKKQSLLKDIKLKRFLDEN